jgi:hypothetical protein
MPKYMPDYLSHTYAAVRNPLTSNCHNTNERCAYTPTAHAPAAAALQILTSAKHRTRVHHTPTRVPLLLLPLLLL